MAENMTEFTVKLADIPVRIRAIWPELRQFLEDYLTEEEAAFTLETRQEDIEQERIMSARTRAAEGLPALRSSDAYLETLAIYRKLAEELVERDVLLFHGSVVAVDGEAYLFAARSGTGKSTHTRLWREVFGERAVMINDDKPLLRVGEEGVRAYGTPWNGKHHLGGNISAPLRVGEEGVRAYGTPWNGKHHLGGNISAPLKALCILERDKENHVERVSPEEAFPRMLQQCYLSEDGEKAAKTLALLERMCQCVRLYRLGCNMEREAALVSYQGMQEEA